MSRLTRLLLGITFALCLLAPATAQAQATFEIACAPSVVNFLEAGESETINCDLGTGSNRTVGVFVVWRDRSNTISGTTIAGQAASSCSQVTEGGGSLSGQAWYRATTATGNQDIIVTMGAGAGGNSQAIIGAVVVSGTDTGGTPVDGCATNSGSAGTANIVSSLTVSSATNDRALVMHGTRNVTASISTNSTSAYTERHETNDGGGISYSHGDGDGAASVATTATWSNGAFTVEWVTVGFNVNAAPAAGGGCGGGFMLLGAGKCH